MYIFTNADATSSCGQNTEIINANIVAKSYPGCAIKRCALRNLDVDADRCKTHGLDGLSLSMAISCFPNDINYPLLLLWQ